MGHRKRRVPGSGGSNPLTDNGLVGDCKEWVGTFNYAGELGHGHFPLYFEAGSGKDIPTLAVADYFVDPGPFPNGPQTGMLAAMLRRRANVPHSGISCDASGPVGSSGLRRPHPDLYSISRGESSDVLKARSLLRARLFSSPNPNGRV